MRGGLVLVLAILAIAACAGTEPSAPITALQLDSLSVPWRDTATAVVRSAPAGAHFTWLIADTAVATVDANGVVTGKTAGATVLTAAAGSVHASAIVRVEVRFIDVATSLDGSCGLARWGETFCWGNIFWFDPTASYSGQDGPHPSRLPFYWDVQGGGLSDPPAGYSGTGGFFCGIRITGRVDCIGAAGVGQRGNGSFADGFADSVHINFPAKALRVGAAHACVLDAKGAAFCWGLNDQGQLGGFTSGCTTPRISFDGCSSTPFRGILDLFREIAAGGSVTCGVTIGDTLECWGRQIVGTPPPMYFGQTYAVPAAPKLHGLTAGAAHACGISDTGALYCWGANDAGQLGLSIADAVPHVAEAIGGSLRVIAVSAWAKSTCAVTTAGELYCWGANEFGQLGLGNTTRQIGPARVAVGEPVTSVRLSERHACARASSGAVYCWGSTLGGGLGDGLEGGNPFPTKVVTPK
jgi:hypothetical protein